LLFQEDGICRNLLISSPLPPSICLLTLEFDSSDRRHILFYDITELNTEPHFNIIYTDKIVNCISGKDNSFYSATVFLTLMSRGYISGRVEQFLNIMFSLIK
jgi:hypothetical protein